MFAWVMQMNRSMGWKCKSEVDSWEALAERQVRKLAENGEDLLKLEEVD